MLSVFFDVCALFLIAFSTSNEKLAPDKKTICMVIVIVVLLLQILGSVLMK